MLKIGPETSKIVGVKPRAVPWPTFQEVADAIDREDGVKLLTWYRNLPSPPVDDAEKWAILDEINRATVAAMKRR